MSDVLVLTANPARADLTGEDLSRAAAAINGGAGRWLNPGIAAEISTTTIDDTALSAARAALAGRSVDVNRVASANRRKRLLVADMESTIIENEMLDELAEIAGIGPRIADITRRAMNGELDFFAAIRERVALLKDLPVAALDQAGLRIRDMAGAAALVATMRAHGAFCALVSGGFTHYTVAVAARIGFHSHQANSLHIAGDRLAGTIAEPILGREAKLAALEKLAAERGLTPADAVAVGDGANDLAMLGAAGLGVAFHAKPVVAEAARVRVDHGDLTALLYLQGYEAGEIVAALTP